MNPPTIDSSIMEACMLAKAIHGRKWKEMIRLAWFDGNYGSLDRVSGTLQMLRNSEMPERRLSFKVPKAITSNALARLSFCNSKKLPQVCVIDGKVKEWVGIGWIEIKRDPLPTDTYMVYT
jgi:hypothetical protein